VFFLFLKHKKGKYMQEIINKYEVIGKVTLALQQDVSQEKLLRLKNAVEEALSDNPKSKMAQPNTELLNARQVAEALNVSRNTVWRMARDGKLPMVEIRKGCWRFKRQSLIDLTNGGTSVRNHESETRGLNYGKP